MDLTIARAIYAIIKGKRVLVVVGWKTSEHKMFMKIIHINIVILKSVAEKYLVTYSPSEV
jgi:hypothetical protein